MSSQDINVSYYASPMIIPLTLIVVLSPILFACVLFVLPLPSSSTRYFEVILALMAREAYRVIDFHFSSSAGSKMKDVIISKLSDSK